METNAFSLGSSQTPISTQLELNISCKHLRKLDITSESDPMVKVFLLNSHTNVWSYIGHTEFQLNQPNPKFVKSVPVQYFFEENQLLKFMVLDVDDEKKVKENMSIEEVKGANLIGYKVLQLGNIVSKPGSTLTAELEHEGRHGKNGEISVHAQEIIENNRFLRLKMRATNVDRKDMMGLGKSDPFMVIHRGNGQNLFTPIHKTEVIMKNLNPVWKEFVLPLSRLNGGNPDLPIMFEVFDWDNDGGHDLIGQVITTQRELNTKKEFDIIEPNIQKKKGNKYKNSGILHVDLIQEYTIPTFLDYITRGTEINFIVGVDFTGSNGDPLSPQSLHYINHQNPNEYMTAIRAIGDIVAPYDPDQLIPAYGFGACFNGARQANHCFALNLNENNPNCFGIDGVLQAYVNIFPHITLSGPTHFSPILNRLISLAQPYANGEKYFLLLMITDGIITDLDNTIQTLKKAATLPISIIIVGVGAADFTAMEELDNDDNSLKISRDIVQFVPFRKFANQPIASLTKEVLAEVPKQLVQYMLSNNLSPRLPPFQQY